MAKQPTAIQKRITADPRIFKKRDSFAKSIKRTHMSLAIIIFLDVLRNGNSSKGYMHFLFTKLRRPMGTQHPSKSMGTIRNRTIVINNDKVSDFPSAGSPKSQILPKPVNLDSLGIIMAISPVALVY